MDLVEKSQEVRRIFEEVDHEVKTYLSKSNLTCFSGCGHCCANPKVNASVLEFLPLAFDLYTQGQAEAALVALSKEEISEEVCILYKSTSKDLQSGYCTDYKNRGLICRLFGNSSRKNKSGAKEIITCKRIKTEKKDQFEEVSQSINSSMEIPSASGAYSKLSSLDIRLAEEQFPINIAVKKSLEAVLRFMYYQDNKVD